MKKLYALAVVLIGISTNSQIINIPDPAFKNVLVNTPCSDSNGDITVDSDVDTNDDGEIQLGEALAVTSLSITGHGLVNLQGLEFFTNILYFDCSHNALTALDLSTISGLIQLQCSDNAIETLDLSNQQQLEILSCSTNQLHTLNLQNHPSLYFVQCESNQFTELSLCGTAVRTFWCSDNPNLTYISTKNGVISTPSVSRTSAEGPPPLPSFMFYNLPALQTICYDSDEFEAVQYSAGDLTGVSLVTDCDMSCSLGVENIHAEAFTIAPNPTLGNIQIYFGNNLSRDILVYNALGQLVKVIDRNDAAVLTLDLSDLNAGTYFVKSHSAKTIRCIKLVKL